LEKGYKLTVLIRNRSASVMAEKQLTIVEIALNFVISRSVSGEKSQ